MSAFAGCRGLLVVCLVVVCCLAVQGLPYGLPFSPSSLSSSSSSSDGQIDCFPCLYNGRIMIHGETERVSDCSTCSCVNGTTTCQLESCQPLTCKHPVKLEGSCCKVCPYNVTVNEVVPLVPPHTSIEQGQENEIAMGLDVKYAFNSEATSVDGHELWTLRLWMSSSEDGTNELSGTAMEEALTEGQRSQSLRKSPERSFVFEDIRYRFDLTDHTCKEAKFICAKFNKGRNPEMEIYVIPFSFSARPSEGVLTKCVENHFCEAAVMPVNKDDDVSVDGGVNEIPTPSTGGFLQSLLISILDTQRAQLQVEEEHLKVERDLLAEARKFYNEIVDWA